MNIKFFITAATAALSFGVASAQAAPGPTELLISEAPLAIAQAKQIKEIEANRKRKEELRRLQEYLKGL